MAGKPEKYLQLREIYASVYYGSESTHSGEVLLMGKAPKVSQNHNSAYLSGKRTEHMLASSLGRADRNVSSLFTLMVLIQKIYEEKKYV